MSLAAVRAGAGNKFVVEDESLAEVLWAVVWRCGHSPSTHRRRRGTHSVVTRQLMSDGSETAHERPVQILGAGADGEHMGARPIRRWDGIIMWGRHVQYVRLIGLGWQYIRQPIR